MKKALLIIVSAIVLICVSSCTKIESESFGVNPTSLNVSVGQTVQFKIVSRDIDPNNGEIDSYVSEGGSYATVSSTFVTGIAPGKATIVVTFTPKGASVPSHKASLQVTVTD